MPYISKPERDNLDLVFVGAVGLLVVLFLAFGVCR